MSRSSRIAFPLAIAFALTVVAGLDLRLAVANRDFAVETTAVLDQHERHPNGMSIVTDLGLDAHERRAAADAKTEYAVLDEHERRVARTNVTYGAPLDEHERRAASR